MASSSSSHVHQIKYDVFISFRGTDIRYGFLSHLKKELGQKQVDAYVDDRLEGGDEITPALVKAIEGSLISLIIFSKNYASSKWCLEELVKVIECMERNKQIVIPVFYYVDPTDVRHQKGTYGDAFAEHEKSRTNLDKLQNWRSALNIAANLSGFHSSKYGNEVELEEEIVKCLSAKLNLMYQSELTGLVGIEERTADIESLLCLGSTTDVRVIGIWGMGGIGKTTIAAAVFNRWWSEYEGCCFMANIREESDKHGIVYMKNKIISILLKENDLHIGIPSGVPPYVKRRLLRKKVLLILDDVSDLEQLENLVGALDWFGPGSRIIVTTRDKQVLLLGKIVSIYEVEPLHFEEAVKLFILNAFKQSCLDMEWIELSRRVIKYANGNPLALKVLGSFLYGKTKIEWESQLQELKKMPHAKVQNVLRLIYDTLGRKEKKIFLYIACVLKARGSGRTIVSMHDLIQQIGWEIVQEESIDDLGKRSRSWDHANIHRVLTNNMDEMRWPPKSLLVGPWGGNGGSSWDDGIFPGIREITLVSGLWIDSIVVVYDMHGQPFKAQKHGGDGGHNIAEVKLQYPNEFLVNVSGHYGRVWEYPEPYIRSLTFQSNYRSFGPYGVEEGTPFTFATDGRQILGFKGRSGLYLDAIGFHLSSV